MRLFSALVDAASRPVRNYRAGRLGRERLPAADDGGSESHDASDCLKSNGALAAILEDQ